MNIVITIISLIFLYFVISFGLLNMYRDRLGIPDKLEHIYDAPINMKAAKEQYGAMHEKHASLHDYSFISCWLWLHCAYCQNYFYAPLLFTHQCGFHIYLEAMPDTNLLSPSEQDRCDYLNRKYDKLFDINKHRSVAPFPKGHGFRCSKIAYRSYLTPVFLAYHMAIRHHHVIEDIGQPSRSLAASWQQAITSHLPLATTVHERYDSLLSQEYMRATIDPKNLDWLESFILACRMNRCRVHFVPADKISEFERQHDVTYDNINWSSTYTPPAPPTDELEPGWEIC